MRALVRQTQGCTGLYLRRLLTDGRPALEKLPPMEHSTQYEQLADVQQD